MFDEEVLNLLKRLVLKGHKVYLVGGVTRDYLMNMDSHDYDVTTSALPCEIKEAYSDLTIFSYGEKYGTVAIKYKDYLIEITTFRTEEIYEDNRHPSTLKFGSSLEEDVTRRDLTINAIAYDVSTNKFVDIVEGIKDIENKVIRMVGMPKERFKEDGLRILRAIRFYAKYDFKMDKDTSDAVHSCISYLDNISKERITDEVIKMLSFDFKKVYLEFFDVFKYLMPELNQNDLYLFDIDVKDDISFYRLLFLCFNSSDFLKTLSFFKCPNKLKDRIKNIYYNKDLKIKDDLSFVRKEMFRLGKDNFIDLNNYFSLIGLPYAKNETINRAILYGIDLKFLDVSGKDIKALIKCKDEDISNILYLAFIGVVDGKCKNDRDDIIKYLKEIKS